MEGRKDDFGMTEPRSVSSFLRAMMRDYERQWRSAQGHARRHPLQIKVRTLESLIQRDLSNEQFEALLAEGADGDDWELSLLHADLEPRWRAARAGRPFTDS